MKIRTQLAISIVLFLVALLIVAAAVVITNQQVEQISRQQELVKSIELGAGELGYLSNDYLLYNENQQLDRWNSKYAEISDEVAGLSASTPEQQALVDTIKASQLRLNEVFKNVVSTLKDENLGNNSSADKAYIQVSWSRLAVQTRGIIFDASRLSQMMQDQEDQVKQSSNLFIMALLGAFGVFILIDYLLVFGGTIKSIGNLQAGTRIVGSGNLDYTIKARKGSEIGDLADAFNQMTARLKKVTASKADLEKEVAERKRIQEALFQSEQRLRRLYDAGLLGVIYWNLDGQITDANDKFLQMTGYTRADLESGRIDWVNMTPPEFRHLDEQSAIDLRATGVNRAPFEKEYIRKDGSRFPVLVAGAMLDEARFNGVAFVLDITERKRIEDALRESHARLQTVIESMNDAVFVSDVDGNFIQFNEAFATYHKFRNKEECYKKLADYPDYIDVYFADGTLAPLDMWAVPRALRGESAFNAEYILRRKDTNEKWWGSYSFGPIRDRGGKIVGSVVVGRDISDTKRAEEAREQLLVQLKVKTAELENLNEELEVRNEEMAAQAEELECSNEELRNNNDELQRVSASLHETQDYLESLINYANAPIIVWDTSFTITRFNRAFERLSGYMAGEVIGKNLSLLFPAESKDESLDKIKNTLKGEQWESVEIPILHKFGSIRIALWNSANIYDDSHKLLATIAQGQDITRRKQTEKELAEAKSQAELYLDLMGHDISNMHQIIMMQLELAADVLKMEGKLEGDDTELIASSLRTLDKASKLINNVRKLQKLRCGEYKVETVDLTAVLKDALKDYSDLPGKEIDVRFNPDGRSPVQANPLLKDVFSNIVDNAVKHSTGQLTLGVNISKVSHNGSTYYRVAIEDNGNGIPDDKKDEVFHRFKRGQTKARGTGLGLYIVRTLVESFGGRVEIQNRVLDDYTQGTRFLVYLPAAEEENAGNV